MDNFLSMAYWAYEDEYSEPTEAEAQEFYTAFVEMLDTIEVA